jgi:beta-lactamase regulating signal transducer with metallopeptidase domain
MTDFSAAGLALLGRQSLALCLGVALLVLLRGPLLRHFGAGLRYAAWALVPLLMAAATLPASAPAVALKAEAVARFEPLRAAVVPAPAAQPAWPLLLAGLWAAGALAALARLAWLQHRYRQGLRPLAGRWQSPAGSGPALVGLLKPRVALPADFEQRFDARQRELVLAHEDVHRARRDNHWNALGALICLLHWFNPLAWWALRRMRADQELACDAAVMARHPGSEAAYGRALLLAQGPLPAGLPWAGWQSLHPLVERVHMLKLTPRGRGRRTLGLALLAGLTLAGIGAVQAVAADAPPPAAPDVELKLDLSYATGSGASRETFRSQPVLRVPFGQKATVMLNGSPDRPQPGQVAIDIEAQDLGDGKIKLLAELKKGDPLVTVSKPRLVTHNGVKALIEQGRDDPSVNEHLSLAITPTLLTSAARP